MSATFPNIRIGMLCGFESGFIARKAASYKAIAGMVASHSAASYRVIAGMAASHSAAASYRPCAVSSIRVSTTAFKASSVLAPDACDSSKLLS